MGPTPTAAAASRDEVAANAGEANRGDRREGSERARRPPERGIGDVQESRNSAIAAPSAERVNRRAGALS